jgi:hypothetical protein
MFMKYMYVIYSMQNPLPEICYICRDCHNLVRMVESNSGEVYSKIFQEVDSACIAYKTYFRKWIKYNIHNIFHEVDSV